VPAHVSRTLLRALIGIAVMVSVAGAFILWTRRQDRIASGRSPIISFQLAAASAAPPRAEQQTPPRLPPAMAERLAGPPPFVDQGAPFDPTRTAPPPAAASGAPDAPDAAAPPKRPSQEQIRAAARRVPVTVYTTRACPACASARAFLAANQIPFVEKDIESNDRYRRELNAVNPNHTVPTFNVDGQIVVGFDPGRVARIIGSRVEKQLDVKLDVRLPKTTP
jgi:glutaredoxin